MKRGHQVTLERSNFKDKVNQKNVKNVRRRSIKKKRQLQWARIRRKLQGMMQTSKPRCPREE